VSVIVGALTMFGVHEINLGLEIKDFHDLETHWNRKSDFAGSLTRISVQRSCGSRFDISVWSTKNLPFQINYEVFLLFTTNMIKESAFSYKL
jgi:hypothetical protein